MAKDASGRPIPVSIPAPPDHQPQLNPVQEQFIRASQKTEDLMTQVEDLSRRVAVLEQGGGDRLNADLADFERRVDAQMLTQMQEFERRFEAMMAAPPSIPPEIPPEDPTPLPAARRR
jgi:PHD/YefM family antitoxin component YafN of YafNO toxin-antitoxin module